MAVESVQVGRRVHDETGPHRYEPGDYGRFEGRWFGVPPGASAPLLADLSAHAVIDHEDRSITVSPSILVRDGQGREWHGYLERGVWKSC